MIRGLEKVNGGVIIPWTHSRCMKNLGLDQLETKVTATLRFFTLFSRALLRNDFKNCTTLFKLRVLTGGLVSNSCLLPNLVEVLVFIPAGTVFSLEGI